MSHALVELPSFNSAPSPSRHQPFLKEATETLDRLRLGIAALLSEVGTFRRPADIQKTFRLDYTLGRQLFRVASTREVIQAGAAVPSRTSMGRLVSSAEQQGASSSIVQEVWAAYEGFEQLVEKHAGDRTSFNSMIAAVAGTDDEWFLADAQHRRNAFRAMSHTTGMQAKVKFNLGFLNRAVGQPTWSTASLGGVVGLRTLRSLHNVRVHGFALGEDFESHMVSIGDPALGNVLPEFSSQPLPSLKIITDTNWRHRQNVVVEDTVIGNTGAATLFFAEWFKDLKFTDDKIALLGQVKMPVEVMIFDVLMHPQAVLPGSPRLEVFLGDASAPGIYSIPLQHNFQLEHLGRGPNVLITPEVPNYQQMVHKVQSTTAWDLTQYEAWRVRIEFPVYDSTIRIVWDG